MFGKPSTEIMPSMTFSALHSELGARISTRASINTAHIQTIMAFAGGYLFARIEHDKISREAAYLPYAISVIIPCISYYFIALYRHNDMHIGLLNLLFRKIEEAHGSTLNHELRFYELDGFYRDSFNARKISHHAIYLLCLVSPLLIWFDSVISTPIKEQAPISACIAGSQINLQPTVFIVVLALSLYNIYLLLRAQKYRDSLRTR